MKKVLILTVTAGGGHNACAFAMKKLLESRGVQVEIADIVNDYSAPLQKFVTDKGYSIAVASLPHLYNKFYNKYRAADPSNRYKCPSQGTVVSLLGGVLKKISDFKPDVIFCTHFYGAIAVTDLKLITNIPCVSVASCLDFVNSPFWEAGIGVDYLTIPNTDFTDVFVSRGFDKSQLLPYGIPSQPVPDNLDKNEIRRQLCLNEHGFTALVMYGGGYWKGGLKLVNNLLYAAGGRSLQLIVINGKDKDSYKKIEKLKKKLPDVKIVNVGFTKEIHRYLAVADVAITKCGGVSSAEMLNARLPMIVTEKIPAQELYNLGYLSSKGFALSFKNRRELKDILDKMYADPNVLIKMRESAEKLAAIQANGVTSLAEFILSQPEADYSEFKMPEIKKVKGMAKKALGAAYKKDKMAVNTAKK